MTSTATPPTDPATSPQATALDCGCADSPSLSAGASLPSYLQATKATDQPGVPVLLFIENNGFFPNVCPEDFSKTYLVDGSYANERRVEVLKLCMLTVNDELAAQVCKWQRQGYLRLEDLPQDEIELVYRVTDDQGQTTETREIIKEYLEAYRQAVFCKAMELLNERYRATDTKQYAVPKADNMERAADNWEVEYRLCIYKLTGRRGQSAFVELI